MKRIISLLLCATIMLTGCSTTNITQSDSSIAELQETESSVIIEEVSESGENSISDIDYNLNQFTDLSDEKLLQYVEDAVYADLALNLNSDSYTIENITASYISQEYLDEVAFNSQSNIFFGYTLAELNECFQGTRYVFTLGEDGHTTVREMQIIEDTSTEEIIKNIAIGTGVILICVAVSYFSAGTGTPTAVNLFFTAAAKTGVKFALSSAALGGVSAGIVRGVETGDMNEALEAAALAGSEGFKWGAITGVVAGGSSKALSIYRSSKIIPTPRESELKVLEITDDAVEQVSYLNGKKVSNSVKGSTRPDVVVQNADGTVRAIEVKNYNLESSASRSELLSELERQITDRTINLPKGSTQEIVLDVRGRGYATKLINDVISSIRERLNSVYYNIPVTALRY